MITLYAMHIVYIVYTYLYIKKKFCYYVICKFVCPWRFKISILGIWSIYHFLTLLKSQGGPDIWIYRDIYIIRGRKWNFVLLETKSSTFHSNNQNYVLQIGTIKIHSTEKKWGRYFFFKLKMDVEFLYESDQ